MGRNILRTVEIPEENLDKSNINKTSKGMER